MTRQVIQVMRSRCRPRLDPELYFLNKTLFTFFKMSLYPTYLVSVPI